MGLLSAGSIAGPLVGAFASWAGTAPAFLSVAVLSAVTVVVTALAPAGLPMQAGGRAPGGARRRHSASHSPGQRSRWR